MLIWGLTLAARRHLWFDIKVHFDDWLETGWFEIQYQVRFILEYILQKSFETYFISLFWKALTTQSSQSRNTFGLKLQYSIDCRRMLTPAAAFGFGAGYSAKIHLLVQPIEKVSAYLYPRTTLLSSDSYFTEIILF